MAKTETGDVGVVLLMEGTIHAYHLPKIPPKAEEMLADIHGYCVGGSVYDRDKVAKVLRVMSALGLILESSLNDYFALPEDETQSDEDAAFFADQVEKAQRIRGCWEDSRVVEGALTGCGRVYAFAYR